METAVCCTAEGGAAGIPSDSISVETAFGIPPNAGGSAEYSRGDHTHGTPPDPIPAHVGAGDPHAQYALDTDLSSHVSAPDPHTAYALDADLSAHVVAADPHPNYALDSDLSAHIAAADPHTGYQLESASSADHITDATATGKDVIRIADVAALTALLNLATSALKGLVPPSGGGTTNFLRADLSWAAPPGGGGGATINVATLSLPYSSLSHSITVSAGAVSPSSNLLCSLGNMADTEENSQDSLELAALSVIPGSGNFLVYLNFLSPVGGQVKLNYLLS